MATPTQDHRAPISPFASSQISRGYDSRNATRIIVEPTPENQRIYNDIRQTHERTRLQTHVASQQNLLPTPPTPSVSTAHSPIDDPETSSTQDITAQDRDRQKRPRGRRKGPLKDDTRLNTALKRKLKLACPHHRAKKITCDCHDFSRLEEGYRNSLFIQTSNRDRSHDRNGLPLLPIEETLNGAGGAATGPPDHDPIPNDFIDLSAPMGGHEGVVRLGVQQIVSGFNADAIHLDETMLQGSGQTYHPGNDMGGQSPSHVHSEYLEIGSQRHDFPNRWQCEYKGSVDSMSDASSEDPCYWTGPFQKLSDHFRTKHHAYYDISPRFWFVCTLCHAKAQSSNDPEPPLPDFRCTKESCPGSCQRWYYGSTRDESVLESAVATESEARYSWNASPEWNQSGMSGGAWNGDLANSSGAGNSSEHHQFYNPKWDTHSDLCSRHPRDSLRCARKICPERCSSNLKTKTFQSAIQPRDRSRRCPIRLLLCAKPPLGRSLSIILPLLTTIIREIVCLPELNLFPSCAIDTYTIGWWSLVLFLIRFITTWSLKDRARAWAIDEFDYRTRGRRRPRNQAPSDEIFVWYRFGAVTTA